MNLKKFFVATAAAAGAVPGATILATGVGTPPETKVLFGGVMEAIGALSLLLLWVNRDKIKKLRSRKITRLSITLAFLFVVCLGVYIILLRICVVTIPLASQGQQVEAVYFPIWTSGDLGEMVHRSGSREAAVHNYGPDGVHNAIRKMPSFALPATSVILLLTYQAPFTFLTIAFGLLAIHQRAVFFPDRETQGT
jgi:predicted permease